MLRFLVVELVHARKCAAYHDGNPLTTVKRQCGDAVVFVASDGDEEMLRRIMAQLPEEEPYEENFLERVSAGLNRLIPVG